MAGNGVMWLGFGADRALEAKVGQGRGVKLGEWLIWQWIGTEEQKSKVPIIGKVRW